MSLNTDTNPEEFLAMQTARRVYEQRVSPEWVLQTTVEAFSQGKDPDPLKMEDVMVGASDGDDGSVVAIMDGSTTKNKDLAKRFEETFDGKSGGRVAAEAVAGVVRSSTSYSRQLVDEVTDGMNTMLAGNFTEALTDDTKRPATTFCALRVDAEAGKLRVTRVGDTGYRVKMHGEEALGPRITDERKMDVVDAQTRAAEIKRLLAEGVPEEEAVPRGREAIIASLEGQPKLWNNPAATIEGFEGIDHPGFGYVNGTPVPDEFVSYEEYDLADIDEVLVLSDGYFVDPADGSLKAYEAAYDKAMAEDPNRYKVAGLEATKPKDDRAWLHVKFNYLQTPQAA